MAASRIKNASRNLIYATILQIVKIVLVFGNRIIFVKILGASYLGINGLFSNVLGILSLADLGITTTMMYSLYSPLSKGDKEKVSQYVNFFKKIYNVIAIIIAVIGIALIPFLKYLVNLPENIPNIYIYYLLLLANTVLSYLFVYQTTVLSADQKNYIINKYDIITQISLFILQVAILILTRSFTLYLLANVICTFVSNIYKVRKTKKLYPYLKECKKELPKKEKDNIFKNMYSLFFYKIGGVIQNNTDNILISIFAGTIAVGYYSNYSTIILSITGFLTMVFTSLKAGIGNYVVEKEKKDQLRMFNNLEVYNFWLVSFCAICFTILIPDFIEICFGKEYILSTGLLICAVLNFYTSNIRQTLWAYRETTGVFNETKHITLVTSGINIVLSIILGKFYGITGVIGATVISRMIYAWWKEPMIIYKKFFETSPRQYFINYIKRALLMFMILILTFIICYILPIDNLYLLFGVKMLICLIIPNIILFIIYHNSEAIVYLKEGLLKIGRKL